MMAIAVLVLIALLATVFAFAAVGLLWTGKGGGGQMTIPIPLTSKTLSISGPAVGGALCIVAVLWLVYIAVDLVRDSGSGPPALQEVRPTADPQHEDSSWLLSHTVLAQESDGHDAEQSAQQGSAGNNNVEPEPNEEPEPVPGPLFHLPSWSGAPVTGWVYLGRKGDPKNWAFDLENEEALEVGHYMRATKAMLVRADHYSDLSGTLVGRIFRVSEPPVVGTIDRGACAVLADHERVGFGALWVEIQRVECP